MTTKQGPYATFFAGTVIEWKGKSCTGYVPFKEILLNSLEMWPDTGSDIVSVDTTSSTRGRLNERKGKREMVSHEMDAVREVIEALVSEIGPDNVPEEVDVDGALALLTLACDNEPEIEYASEEENANAAMEASAEEVV